MQPSQPVRVQAAGEVLWEIKKTAARDAWREIEPNITGIADIVVSVTIPKEAGHAAAA